MSSKREMVLVLGLRAANQAMSFPPELGKTVYILSMFKPTKNISAGELLRKLEADPEFVRRRQESDKALAERTARSRTDQIPLISDLNALGVRIESVWDLVNSTLPYDQAIPVLLAHLQKPYSASIREGIARALAVPATRSVGWLTLIEEFRKTDVKNKQLKDGLAVALSGASDDSVLADLISLAKDENHGRSRILLLWGIRRSKLPVAKQAILDLANDPELSKEIKSWRKGRD